MTNWLEKHEAYVLINRNQYQVLLDNLDEPTEMWTNIAFADGDCVCIDGGRPSYILKDGDILGMGLYRFKMEQA